MDFSQCLNHEDHESCQLYRGVPEGPTAYVLTAEDNGANWLWNAVTGERCESES